MGERIYKHSLDYHSQYPPGKIEVVPTKAHSTQRDLALAYSPGVAAPCLAIESDESKVYDYTAKGNLVAVISNGTAVLGLGDIGAAASKPVMEGKGLLFKTFAGIDVFDIEINEKDPQKFVEIVESISPTFGGINLEDIKAPEAFYIESELKKRLNIPVMHDDQHGTAIISAAALINALEITGKSAAEVRVVVNGAGAAAIACTRLYMKLGIAAENILMCDSKGVIRVDRPGLTEEKLEFARETDFDSLADALTGADVFIGLSKGNVMTADMLLSMADKPIVFAMANPDPEIEYKTALATRPDVIMATGRSDHPNQVNNVLGFPYIFRGALDVQASGINDEMKIAAVYALANLAKEPVPELVLNAYNDKSLSFGKNYIIPKPFDNRLITTVSMAVAKAAMESGVARKPIIDWAAYEDQLLSRMGNDQKLLRMLQNRARSKARKLVFNHAEEYNVLRAAQIMQDDHLCTPILLGNKKIIQKTMQNHGIEMDVEILDPRSDEIEMLREKYAHKYWDKRKRRGVTLYEARRDMRSRDYFGSMLLEEGYADAFITGYAQSYVKSLRPVLEVIGKEKGISKVSGLMILLTSKGPMFFADTAIIQNPDWKDLVRIAMMTHYVVKGIGLKPRIAMLSYENFSRSNAVSEKVARAVAFLHKRFPDMVVDGEIQPDFALDGALSLAEFPFSRLAGKRANVMIFPNLESSNLAYKIIRGMGKTPTVGPVLLGMRKPVHILQTRCSIEEIVNLATIAVLDAQQSKYDNTSAR
ncbi:MAG: NADP-dependent malic enzyme [Weeksellaceae bacterium]|nr:NADP-dependent malic enzyme [Weeksellaceae bacterium]